MPTIALVTSIAHYGRDADLAPLADACGRAGLEPVVVAWDDGTVSWPRYDTILLRSPWDYTVRLQAFLDWCARGDVSARLLNPPDVVRWNVDKRYLRDLATAGVPVIDSRWLAPGDDIVLPDSGEFVLKPCVGAGCLGVRRFRADEHEAARAYARGLLAGGTHVLLQPYLAAVDGTGETALVFYEGRFSHALRKAPLLARDARVGGEHIRSAEATPAELEVARKALAALPFPTPVYARVDLLPGPDGPRLLELELVEPSMFFACAPQAADRFAAVLRRHLED